MARTETRPARETAAPEVMIRATPEDSIALGLPVGAIPAAPRRDQFGSFLDGIGVFFGFGGEGPMRRIVGLAVVVGVIVLLGWLIFRKR